MKVAVHGLGRLQSAVIDLNRDLILFTGPNNTSKTYVAYLVYGLASTEWFPAEPMDFARPLFERLHDSLGYSPSCEFDVKELITYLPGYLRNSLADQGAELVRDLFASNPKSFAGVSIQVLLNAQDLQRAEESQVRAKHSEFYGEVSVFKEKDGAVFHVSVPDRGEPPDEGEVVAGLQEALNDHLREAARELFPSAVILPAERSAIQIFSQELTIGRATVADYVEPGGGAGKKVRALWRQARRYPLPIRDCLRIASDLATLQKRSSPFAPLADLLEQQVLRGAVRATDRGEIVFTPEGTQTALDLHLSSSSIKSLSLLSFYLRHILDPGDLLIIDEPELNLHPDNQRLVARVLARVARSGARVLVSTHSDYFIREVNNLIMLASDADGALRDELGYAAEEVLKPEQVGAYLFQPDTAEEIPVTRTGFAVKTIDREINRLNNDSEKIYLTLFGQEG